MLLVLVLPRLIAGLLLLLLEALVLALVRLGDLIVGISYVVSRPPSSIGSHAGSHSSSARGAE